MTTVSTAPAGVPSLAGRVWVADVDGLAGKPLVTELTTRTPTDGGAATVRANMLQAARADVKAAPFLVAGDSFKGAVSLAMSVLKDFSDISSRWDEPAVAVLQSQAGAYYLAPIGLVSEVSDGSKVVTYPEVAKRDYELSDDYLFRKKIARYDEQWKRESDALRAVVGLSGESNPNWVDFRKNSTATASAKALIKLPLVGPVLI